MPFPLSPDMHCRRKPLQVKYFATVACVKRDRHGRMSITLWPRRDTPHSLQNLYPPSPHAVPHDVSQSPAWSAPDKVLLGIPTLWASNSPLSPS